MKRDQSMWYAYVVSRPKSSNPQPWPHGLTPALSVVTVPITSSISILASPVPAELFLPSEDQAWITDAAMAHHQVVLAGHLRGDVLPLQFGTVFRNQEELQVHFSQLAPALEARLDAIADCDEVELTLVGENPSEAWQELESKLSPDIRSSVVHSPSSRAYLIQRTGKTLADFANERFEIAGVWPPYSFAGGDLAV